MEKFSPRASGEIQALSPEEVWALVREASSEQDGALFLTAAFTGLRMGELLALCWRDVDFSGATLRVRAGYYLGQLTTPKSGKVRAVPMARMWRPRSPSSAGERTGLGTTTWCSPVRPAATSTGRHSVVATRTLWLAPRCGRCASTTCATRFGTRMIGKADIRRVQEWMGHADVQTTMRYLHYAPRSEDAALVAEAFAVPQVVDDTVRSD
ncbi:MAG: tyrosine-type recombinase/integrase [Solirubrobacteraceae bacterium]